MCCVAWDLPTPAVSPERSETIEQAGLRERLRLRSWLRRGLWALLFTSVPPKCSENIKRAGLWVHLEPQDLPVMLPLECLENVEQAGLRALCSTMLPPRMLGERRAGGAAGGAMGPLLRHAPPGMLGEC